MSILNLFLNSLYILIVLNILVGKLTFQVLDLFLVAFFLKDEIVLAFLVVLAFLAQFSELIF
jgi:hypothetical protein